MAENYGFLLPGQEEAAEYLLSLWATIGTPHAAQLQMWLILRSLSAYQELVGEKAAIGGESIGHVLDKGQGPLALQKLNSNSHQLVARDGSNCSPDLEGCMFPIQVYCRAWVFAVGSSTTLPFLHMNWLRH